MLNVFALYLVWLDEYIYYQQLLKALNKQTKKHVLVFIIELCITLEGLLTDPYIVIMQF